MRHYTTNARRIVRQGDTHTNILINLVCIFFVATFALKSFTDAVYVSQNIASGFVYLKYFTAALACFFAYVAFQHFDRRVFSKEFNCLLVIWSLFAAVSAIQALYTGVFSSEVLLELIKLATLILLSFCILNAISSDQLYKCMVAILAVSILGYLLELFVSGASIIDVVTADFSKSYSPTESSFSANTACALLFYFLYFNKKKGWTFLSLIFSLLTFKRLNIVIAIAGVAVVLLVKSYKKIKVKNGVLVLIQVLTILLVAFWFWLLLPEQAYTFADIFGESQSNFTSGRSQIMNYILNSDFSSYGFGSATIEARRVFGFGLEMDCIRIALEMSPIILIAFLILMWKIPGNSFWSVCIMGYVMLKMITAGYLGGNFTMTLILVTIGSINCHTPMDQSTALSFKNCSTN